MSDYILKVKKLHKDAKKPTYAHEDDSGMDLYSVEDIIIQKGQRRLVKTGIAIELPKNTEAQIRPKSGLALKHGISIVNTPGTIDEGYRGEVGVIMLNTGVSPYVVNKGSKIAQMVICPVIRPEIKPVAELSNTERNEGGYGSTGDK